MQKPKIKILINPLADKQKAPINLVELSEVFDFIVAKFEIDSINIQLSEEKKPSEFYFSLLSELCKINSKKVLVDNYVGNKNNNKLSLDSFSMLNLIIDNNNGFTVIYDNEKHILKDPTSLIAILSVF